VLSAVAEHENRIRAHFYTQEVNTAGIYLMSFFVDGIERPVIVDDWFPVHKADNTKPCFARSKDEELWVMLMEKAWAKLNGNYARSQAGYTHVACQLLLGVSTERSFHNDIENKPDKVDLFWRQLV
jgi:calpain-15